MKITKELLEKNNISLFYYLDFETAQPIIELTWRDEKFKKNLSIDLLHGEMTDIINEMVGCYLLKERKLKLNKIKNNVHT